MSEWIRTADRLPEPGSIVIAGWAKPWESDAEIVVYAGPVPNGKGNWHQYRVGESQYETPTHWIPLAALPPVPIEGEYVVTSNGTCTYTPGVFPKPKRA